MSRLLSIRTAFVAATCALAVSFVTAAALAAAGPLTALGSAVVDPILLETPHAARDGDAGVGVVVGTDRFGNATTNLPGEWATKGGAVEVAGRRIRLARCYGDVASGEALALVDSEGWIELAVRDASAAERLGLAEGTPVRLVPA